MRNTISGSPHRTFRKMLVDAATGKVVGCHMVGDEAAEIMQVRGQGQAFLVGMPFDGCGTAALACTYELVASLRFPSAARHLQPAGLAPRAAACPQAPACLSDPHRRCAQGFAVAIKAGVTKEQVDSTVGGPAAPAAPLAHCGPFGHGPGGLCVGQVHSRRVLAAPLPAAHTTCCRLHAQIGIHPSAAEELVTMRSPARKIRREEAAKAAQQSRASALWDGKMQATQTQSAFGLRVV
jgi:hypothetical protein